MRMQPAAQPNQQAILLQRFNARKTEAARAHSPDPPGFARPDGRGRLSPHESIGGFAASTSGRADLREKKMGMAFGHAPKSAMIGSYSFFSSPPSAGADSFSA